MGHRVVARIARAMMNAPAREHIAVLFKVGSDPGRESRAHEAFVAAATWADEVRPARHETYNWHFVDIPVSEARYDAARDCPATEKGDCAINAMARARTEAVDPQRSPTLWAEALKSLIHFVGDLHQPIHAIDNQDRGGDDVKVSALRGGDGRDPNLHAVRDNGLINLSPETEAARAERLLSQLLQQSPPQRVTLEPVQWAGESHELGLRVVYRCPSFLSTGPGPDPIVLDDAYRSAANAEIHRRQQLAGSMSALLIWRLK